VARRWKIVFEDTLLCRGCGVQSAEHPKFTRSSPCFRRHVWWFLFKIRPGRTFCCRTESPFCRPSRRLSGLHPHAHAVTARCRRSLVLRCASQGAGVCFGLNADGRDSITAVLGLDGQGRRRRDGVFMDTAMVGRCPADTPRWWRQRCCA